MTFLIYVLCGAAATVVHFAVLVGLVEGAQALPALGSMAGAAAGALVGYALNRRFSFRHTGAHAVALPRFLAVAALGALLNGALMHLATAGFGWNYLLSQVLVAFGVVGITYRINRAWTFR